jgi:membrane protease YdiL (CAAX protease family)
MMRLLLGLALAFVVFDRLAHATGSGRGEAGLLVGAVVVALLVVLQTTLFGERPLGRALASLGLGRPAARGMAAALAVCALLLAFFPVFARARGAPLGMHEGWLPLVPGLFAQAGVGEETLFRGYLFGHLRRQRSFWRAAALSVPPFVAAHLLLFTYMPAPLAAAASLLALVTSFPLARLYDLGGRTVWAPALVHFAMQAAIKLVTAPAPEQMPMSLAWMATCMLVPWLVFAVPLSTAAPIQTTKRLP